MKTIWKKTPAWIKAILLNILWLYPANLAIQTLVQTNLRTNASWGWALIPSILLLVVFWYAAKKFCFKGETEIKLSFSAKDMHAGSWLSVGGVVMLAIGTSLLCACLLDVGSTRQATAIGFFRQFQPVVAIPLLTALALMAAVVEEVVYRGILQNTLRNYPKWINFFLVATFFALAHLLPLALLAPYMFLSLLFSVLADKWKSTFPAIIAHFVIDISIFLFIYFGVIDFEGLETRHLFIGLSLFVLGGAMIKVGFSSNKSAVRMA